LAIENFPDSQPPFAAPPKDCLIIKSSSEILEPFNVAGKLCTIGNVPWRIQAFIFVNDASSVLIWAVALVSLAVLVEQLLRRAVWAAWLGMQIWEAVRREWLIDKLPKRR